MGGHVTSVTVCHISAHGRHAAALRQLSEKLAIARKKSPIFSFSGRHVRKIFVTQISMENDVDRGEHIGESLGIDSPSGFRV